MKSFNHSSGKNYDIEGAKIYVKSIGDNTLPVMLLLHRGFGNNEDFNCILPLFDKEYHFIGIDSRGQGKSTMGNKTLSYAQLQKDVEAVLKILNIRELSILGVSDGGIVAYRLATMSSLKIDKLITVSSRWNIQNALDTRDQLRKYSLDWQRQEVKSYEKYQAINPEPNFIKLSESLQKMWLDNTETGYPNQVIQRINCPTLIFKGDSDPIIKRSFVTAAGALISKASLAIIPFAAHEVYADKPSIFMEIVNEFLNEQAT